MITPTNMKHSGEDLSNKLLAAFINKDIFHQKFKRLVDDLTRSSSNYQASSSKSTVPSSRESHHGVSLYQK